MYKQLLMFTHNKNVSHLKLDLFLFFIFVHLNFFFSFSFFTFIFIIIIIVSSLFHFTLSFMHSFLYLFKTCGLFNMFFTICITLIASLLYLNIHCPQLQLCHLQIFSYSSKINIYFEPIIHTHVHFILYIS